ncbi:hypothetical protein AB0J72_48290 [Dactylosporangium sp. NPDC049742]|uniref:hypothetical protein n=1 Tax=Dactylosporangium sp. NPDC049742 TaxID=3154737 RepID=UPI0034469334
MVEATDATPRPSQDSMRLARNTGSDRRQTPADSTTMAVAMTASPAVIAPGRPMRRIAAAAVVEASTTPALNSRKPLPDAAADRPSPCSGLSLAGSVDRVVGIHLITAIRVTLCHGQRPGPPVPSIRSR